MPGARPIFYVSDGTGITAETIGHSLLTQFTETEFKSDRMPFIDTNEKAHEAARNIRLAGEAAGERPVVVSSCVNQEIAEIVASSGALVLDIFEPFIAPLERELGKQRQPRVGKAHGIVNFDTYHQRINAMNYALTHDDGVRLDYKDAEVILLGVSRAGKTPTCVYLALHHGIRAANYPLTEEDLETDRLPAKLRPYKHKIFGLTIDPDRLHQIRQERRPDSRYSSLETCKREIAAADVIFRTEGIPVLSTTHASIEEISSRVLESLGINREMY